MSVLLTLPALFLSICGVLHTAFGLVAANDFLGAALVTVVGRVLLSPIVVLGGLLASLALNLWALCRIRIGFDTGTVYVTFYVARSVSHLILAAFAGLLGFVLLYYAFVENFRIVAK